MLFGSTCPCSLFFSSCIWSPRNSSCASRRRDMTIQPITPPAGRVSGREKGLLTHLSNIYRLMVKELRSIRADPMVLVLVVYTFSVAIYTVATGASTEAKDLTVGVVDEDNSELSRRLPNALNPPLFKPAVLIPASEIDANMESERLIFVLEIPP